MEAIIAIMRNKNIPLKVEFVTTSEEWDDLLGVWIFYETQADVTKYEIDGTTEFIKLAFVNELAVSKSRFSFSELPKTNFVLDSRENVDKNFKGSYFLRMR
jgi:hypothetical protein